MNLKKMLMGSVLGSIFFGVAVSFAFAANTTVVVMGDTAAGECARHNIEHIAVCHPSRRGSTNEKNAIAIADAIAALGFRGIAKDTGTQDGR